MKFFWLMLTLGVFATLAGCAGREKAPDFAQDYIAALQQFPAVPPADPEAAVARFVSVFTHLTDDDVGERARRAYAETLFFNDTLHSATDRDTLVAYLEATGNAVDSIEVDLLSWTLDGGDLYVRWGMRTRFTVTRRAIDSYTVGMTHLRFNEAGDIVLHQDFWDSTQGFYQHLPIVGGMVRWIRGRL
ncbi:hypothetical protein [Isoalcanivorax indicus]|uniref:hypothetical protein n=1 Tax=Isoalcanivorax indicus TaxID=2202653 RepID=UPI0013C3E99E|nr:hypothetical protein [Isoalcanivorax indicus]